MRLIAGTGSGTGKDAYEFLVDLITIWEESVILKFLVLVFKICIFFLKLERAYSLYQVILKCVTSFLLEPAGSIFVAVVILFNVYYF